MATESSSSSNDAYSTTHSIDIYYSNEDVALLHEIVVQAESLLPTLPEQERFPTHALFTVYHDLLPKKGLVTDGETKFRRVLFKIGGAPYDLTLLENFENVLSRMGIDVEFSVKDGGTRTGLDAIRAHREEAGTATDHEDGDHGSRPMDIAQSTLASAIYPLPSTRSYPESNPDEHTNGGYENGTWSSERDRLEPPIGSTTFSEGDLFHTQGVEQDKVNTSDHSITPSEATIAGMREALALRHYGRYRLLHVVDLWKTAALGQKADNVGLASIAEHRDRRVLLQSAVEDWRLKLEAKRKLHGTDDADAALARRHIVRSKFFFAWKNFTALQKLLAQEAEEAARKIIEETRRAALMSKYFLQWKATIAQQKLREQAATSFFTSRLKRKVFGSDLRRTIAGPSILDLQSEPDTLPVSFDDAPKSAAYRMTPSKYVVKLTNNDPISCGQVDTVKDQASVIPRKQTCSSISPQPTFDMWRQRTRQDEEAISLDRTKILREAWTVWQDSMRIHMVHENIISRVLSQCLYRLISTARATAFTRRANERVKRAVFISWRRSARNVSNVGEYQDATAQTHLTNRRKDVCFARLISQLERHEKSGELASQFRSTQLLRNELGRWETKVQHANELKKWSKDARFFFLTTRTFNKWKNAAEESKREKRKLAYAQLRRSQKMSLARNTLKSWRERTQQIVQLAQQAENVGRNRCVVSAMDILDRWRAHTEDLTEMEVTAVKMQQRKAKNVWVDRLKAVQDLGIEADGIYIQKRGKQSMRQWSLEVLKVRAKSNYAEDILDKNSKKVFRRTFTAWKIKSLKPQSPEPLLTTARASRYAQSTYVATPIVVEEGSELIALEALEIDFETPSKPPRLPTTTPVAPLSTAAESRLRAQFADSSRSVRRSLRREIRGVGTPRES